MKSDFNEMIVKEILLLLEETFFKHHGAFTDKGSSFFETLQNIDYVLASKKINNINETIAGHVFHTHFYIVVLQEYITDVRTGKTDWDQSWIVKSVNKTEWEDLKKSLYNEYHILVAFIESINKWENSDYFGGVLSILMHCAYHLGAIRQLVNLSDT